MTDYSFEVGEQITFLNEEGGGKIVAFLPDNIVTILTEDDFEMPYPRAALVPRFDLMADKPKPEVKKEAGPIMTSAGYKLGMRVQFVDSEETAIILEFFKDGCALLEREDLFTERIHLDKVVATDNLQAKRIHESMADVSLQDIGEDHRSSNSERALKDRKDQGVWEIDLHIQELIDNSHGMMKHEIVQLQLDHFDKKLNEAINRDMRKVIFIHGRGEGRLRNAIREVLKRYPNCEFLDADYKRYGVGATEVRIKYRPKEED